MPAFRLASILLALASLLALEQVAAACSPEPDPDEQPRYDDPDVPIEGIPVEGVVPIHADIPPAADLVVVVAEADGTRVTGSYEWVDQRVVWRAASPLAPGARYDLTVASEIFDVDETFGFVTQATPAPLEPSLAAEVIMSETSYSVRTLCCDLPGEPSSSCESGVACWHVEYQYVPLATLALDLDDGVRRFWTFEVTTDLHGWFEGSFDGLGAGEVLMNLDDYADAYCFTIHATSLIDGTVLSATRCAASSEIDPSSRQLPEVPDPAVCDGDIYDRATDDVVTEVDDGGCAAGGTAGGLAALVPLALLAVGRRRRRLSAGS